MKQKGKRTLTPRLRFPEFRGTPGWNSQSIEQVCEILNNRRVPITSSDRRPGPYPYYGASGIVDYVDDFIFDERLVLVGEDGAKWQAFEPTAFIADGKYWVNNHAHVLKPTELIDTLLANYLILQDVGGYVTGAAPPKLTLQKLKTIPIPVPPPAEQQQIADCLDSLDGLIAAEGRKLAALRDHKRGLMQQLFPQPGQTQPRLRFPEFRDKGEWTSEKLGRICKFVRGPFGGALKKEIFVPAGYAVYEQSHAIHKDLDTFRYYIDEIKYNELKRFAVKPNDIIMSCSGTMGKFAVLSSKPTPGVINQALLKLSVDNKYDLGFIAIALELPGNQSRLLAQSAGGAIKNVVGVKLLKEIEINVPAKQEQRRIADCLSALDDRITAQAEKIESLKQHKRGLMQQLFPALEEQ